ncbi:hypothetical protein [Tenacibaculum ovolyticum]|uniref:hypothetical protein n=1 Tax=Tenacibaculum ovolyticum TaxID=104270 RepID=UPI00048B980A|nr:hypothetical protein [Tenacibaculum ovolyticum]
MEGIDIIMEQIANKQGTIQTYAAKVIAINREEKSKHNSEEAFTVNVLRSDGAEINNVRLKASIQDKEQGVVCVPKLNSWVFISIIETTETRAFISQYSEIEKIFLRIKDNENKFFELQSDVNSTSLLFKKEEKKGKETTYKNSTSLEFNGVEKALNVKFWNEEENKITHQTTVAQDKVTVNFEEGEGYQLLVDKDKVLINKGDLNFKLESKFNIQVGSFNLFSELESLINEIKKIVVVQGVSPDVGALTTISKNIEQILE